MAVTLDQIKTLRESTGLSIMECKKALNESEGNIEKALEILRKKGETKASKVAERKTSQGIVSSYIHNNNQLGVLIKLECETDFVAKNEDFLALGRDIAMHIAASNPKCISPEEVSEDEVKKEKEIWLEQLKQEGKPENIIDNIIDGKEKKYREEISLLKQPYVKNPEITIEDLLKEKIMKLGENIKVANFERVSF